MREAGFRAVGSAVRVARTRSLAAISLAALTIASGGCGGSHASRHARVVLAPASALFDQPMHIVVEGAGSERTVTIALRSVDGAGTAFVAQATFRSSGPAGSISRPRRRAVGGSIGRYPMGLIDAMQSASGRTPV